VGGLELARPRLEEVLESSDIRLLLLLHIKVDVLEAKVIGISLPTCLTWTACCEWILLLPHVLLGVWVRVVRWVLVRDWVLWLDHDHASCEWIVTHSTHELCVGVKVVLLLLEVLVHCRSHLGHHGILGGLKLVIHRRAHLSHHGVHVGSVLILRWSGVLVVMAGDCQPGHDLIELGNWIVLLGCRFWLRWLLLLLHLWCSHTEARGSWVSHWLWLHWRLCLELWCWLAIARAQDVEEIFLRCCWLLSALSLLLGVDVRGCERCICN